MLHKRPCQTSSSYSEKNEPPLHMRSRIELIILIVVICCAQGALSFFGK